MTAAGDSTERGIGDRIAATWNDFWFRPVAARQLAIVRFLGGALAIALWWSYAADLDTWFGPSGMISPGLLAEWRSAHALSLFDVATSAGALRLAYLAGGLMLLGLTVGCATPVTGPLAAVAFVSLLHRGPMLVGPADDVVAIVLWCLVIGRSGDAVSVDRLVGCWLGWPPAAPSIRTRIAIGLLRIHATVLAVAALLAQLKGDVWWNGTAAWWLAARADSPLVDLAGPFLQSEYLMNLVTHAIVFFEIVFAAGIWIPAVSRPVAIAGLVGWPLIGVVAGEPAWGAALAVLAIACLPASAESPD